MHMRIQGVTMVELLIVLLIIGITFGLAIPGFQSMMARNRMATQVNDLVLAINLARSEAGKTGGTVSLQATDPGDSDNEFGPGYCVVAGNPGDCSGTLIRSFPALAEGSTLNSVEDVVSLQFSPIGALATVDSQPRSLDLCYSGAEGKRISISLIGRAKSYKADDPDVGKRPSC